MKKLLFYLIMLSLVAGSVLTVDYIVYKNKIRSYYDALIRQYNKDNYPILSENQIVNLGWAHPDSTVKLFSNSSPASSYIFFGKKKPGTIRIICLGDSYTMGDELGPGLDFPSRLQGLLRQKGFTNYEVVNFGTSGYGVVQSYLLFQYLKDIYQPDIIILNLFDHLIVRDNTFKYHEYAPVHARYIEKSDSLCFIPVQGVTREEAIKNYYRFFQSWAYLRYDVKTPQFLKVFFNSFTEYGFEQHYNPFYYRPDTYRKTTRYAEAEELYTLLIKKFSEQCKRTIVIANDSTIEGILNRGNFANIEMLKPVITNVAKQNKAVYRMPRYHYSGTGAFLLAKELSSLITHTPDTLSYTTMQEAETDSMALPTNEPLLTNYDSICFTANGQLMGLLFKNPHPEQNIAFIIKADLKKDNINTLLLTTSNYHDLIFIPLAKRPADNTNVQIETDGDSNKNFSIGTIHYINPFVCEIIPPEKNQMLNRQVNYIGETQSGWLVAAKSKKIGRASLNIDGNFIALSVSDTTLNNTRGNTNYILTMPALYAIRSAPDACFVAADTSRKVGYYLVAHKNGIAQNFPFAQLSVEHKIVRH